MPEPLTPAQQQTLQQLNTTIDTIVTAGTQPALMATGVLNGALAGSPEATDLHTRFQQLGNCLRGLGALVQVNPGMPASMAANTVITLGPNPTVQSLEVRPDLVAPIRPGLTHYPLTLVHELSHALNENGVYPVKDYAYRKGWAWGYLLPALAAANADSYAEAAAQLADTLDGRPGRHQAFGPVPAQRDYLRTVENETTLGAALAWVEIVVNRAWIRSFDTVALAESRYADAQWPAQLATWHADPERKALLQFELHLEKAEIIGARSSPLGSTGLGSTGLGTLSRWAVQAIHAAIAELKNELGKLEPVPVSAGTEVVYDSKTNVLTVPHAVADENALALGDRVLRALIAATAPSGFLAPGWAARLREIIDWLMTCDRPQERAALQPQLQHFANVPNLNPSVAQWTAIAGGLKRAALNDIRALWEVMAEQATDLAALPTAQRTALEHLDTSLARDVNRAVAIGKQLVAPAQVEFQALAVALFKIATAAKTTYPSTAPRYKALRTSLEPFM